MQRNTLHWLMYIMYGSWIKLGQLSLNWFEKSPQVYIDMSYVFLNLNSMLILLLQKEK